MISADEITRELFNETLQRYDDVIVSLGRASVKTKMSLAELDRFRYTEVLNRYSAVSKEENDVLMTVDDLVQLVDWKMTHEKRRPRLYELASSNSSDLVKTATQKGFSHFRKNPSDPVGAIKLLSELKGVGPATASLLLAVYDPKNVIFFADEIYHWLCLDGKAAHLKYDLKEYQELFTRARKLCERLIISCIDVEKVGYVLMKEKDAQGTTKSGKKATKAEDKGAKLEYGGEKKAKEELPKEQASEQDPDQKPTKKEAEDETRELRRSKRRKI